MTDQPTAQDSGLFATQAMDEEEVIDVLNDLLIATRADRAGFTACAEAVQLTLALKDILRGRAQAFRQAEVQLVAMIRVYGVEPTKKGTGNGSLRKGWRPLPQISGGSSDAYILEACVRGENAAVARYHHALAEQLPTQVRDLVQQQLESVQRNHAKIRGLRDAAGSLRT